MAIERYTASQEVPIEGTYRADTEFISRIFGQAKQNVAALSAMGEKIGQYGEEMEQKKKNAILQLQQTRDKTAGLKYSTLSSSYSKELTASLQAEPDMKKWDSIQTKIRQRFEKDINALDATPETKRIISESWNADLTRMQGEVVASKIKKVREDYLFELTNTVTTSAENGDIASAQQALQLAEDGEGQDASPSELQALKEMRKAAYAKYWTNQSSLDPEYTAKVMEVTKQLMAGEKVEAATEQQKSMVQAAQAIKDADILDASTATAIQRAAISNGKIMEDNKKMAAGTSIMNAERSAYGLIEAASRGEPSPTISQIMERYSEASSIDPEGATKSLQRMFGLLDKLTEYRQNPVKVSGLAALDKMNVAVDNLFNGKITRDQYAAQFVNNMTYLTSEDQQRFQKERIETYNKASYRTAKSAIGAYRSTYNAYVTSLDSIQMQLINGGGGAGLDSLLRGKEELVKAAGWIQASFEGDVDTLVASGVYEQGDLLMAIDSLWREKYNLSDTDMIKQYGEFREKSGEKESLKCPYYQLEKGWSSLTKNQQAQAIAYSSAGISYLEYRGTVKTRLVGDTAVNKDGVEITWTGTKWVTKDDK